ncbi:hypothetical protein GGG17_12610 [Arsenicicoccus sp. MKL-02]|uniref:Head-tail adaptor protein n=1 Tax=Arsenicicoccus cauae TaxID=2663847 RepID=A0A6I3IEX2_9MICO|nr:hypothetical protein [Arsenicicoccus cauae]MTB72788.1 hypothetical protein [Arsenicicoccus cauae]
MKLSDQIEIVTARTWEDGFGEVQYDWAHPTLVWTLPAQVTYLSTALNDGGGDFMLSQELRVIVPVVGFDAAKHRVRWRGTLYQANGQPLIRMRGGTPHHLTIPIKLVTG